MIDSLTATATAVALAISLPIIALGERLRARGGADRHTSSTRKETTP